MLCKKCFDDVAEFNEKTGFGTKFVLKEGKEICEHCVNKAKRSLASLEQLKEKKRRQKEEGV